MKNITEFVFSFLTDGFPFVLIVLPMYVILRMIYLGLKGSIKRKKLDEPFREVVMLMFVIYLTLLFVQTWVVDTGGANEINLIPFSIIREQIISRNHSDSSYRLFLLNILGNIGVFVPIGMCLAYFYQSSVRKTALAGFCLSLVIELGQLPLDRTSDVDDLILNTSGAIIGWLIYITLVWFMRKMKKAEYIRS